MNANPVFPYWCPGRYLLVKNSPRGHATIILTTHYCSCQLSNNYTVNLEVHLKNDESMS